MRSWVDYNRSTGYGPACLSMYFSEHSHNPYHPQYSDMRRKFSTWLDNTQNYPRLIRCEGRVPDVSPTDDEKSCIRGERSEPALLALWAKQFGIEIKSFEPPTAQQAEDLQGYEYGRKPRNNIFYYYIARQQRQIAQSMPPATLSPEAYMRIGFEATIKRYEQELRWQDFEYSFDHFAHIHKLNYPDRPLDLLDTQFFLDETMNGMHNPDSTIQMVSYYANRHRERHAARVIWDDLKHGKYVFAAFGKLHRYSFEYESAL